MKNEKWRDGHALALMATILFACGGQGSGHPDRPAAAVTAGPKTLTLSWPSVPGATSYRVREDPDGSGYVELARELTATAYTVDVSVHRFPWTTARFRVDACAAGGCVESEPVSVADRMLGAIGYLKASNPDRGDLFGYAVALSGDGETLAVGAIGESGGALVASSGAVHVFARTGGRWAHQARLEPSLPQPHGGVGYAVALSADGDTLAVGAPMRFGSGYQSGGVWVFTRDGDSWSQEAALEPSGGFESFGAAVALSADGATLAVGAPASTGFGGGSAYVFRRDGAHRWSRETALASADPRPRDSFGAAVALSGDGRTLAAGETNASDDETSPAYRAGVVHVYVRADSGWAAAGDLTASNPGPGDEFGLRVALSGDGSTLAVGATGGDAEAQADRSAPRAGAVYVFTNGGSGWTQQSCLEPSRIWSYAEFGAALGLSTDGSTLAVGAWGEPADARGVGGDPDAATGLGGKGAVYLFQRAAERWSQASYVKASNTGELDDFGFSVALSGDGRTLAAGAWGERSAAVGIDGAQDDDSLPQSGAVYLY